MGAATAGNFVTGGWSLCERCRLTAGLRRDDLRDDFSGTAPGAASRRPRPPRPGRRARDERAPRVGSRPVCRLHAGFESLQGADARSALRPAAVSQRQRRHVHHSNPDLRPQRARNIEAGLGRTALDKRVVARGLPDDRDRRESTSIRRRSPITTSAAACIAASRPAWPWIKRRGSPPPHLRLDARRRYDKRLSQLKNIPEHVAQLLLHARITATNTRRPHIPLDARNDAGRRWPVSS